MLQHSIYLKHPIHRYVDDLGDTFEQLMLTECEWQQAKVLLLFLLPFQRCTSRFESNNTTSKIDYVFFAYDTLSNVHRSSRFTVYPPIRVDRCPEPQLQGPTDSIFGRVSGTPGSIDCRIGHDNIAARPDRVYVG